MHVSVLNYSLKSLFVAAIIITFATGCKQSAPEGNKKGAAKDDSSKDKEGATEKEECSSLALTAELNWEDDIQKIVKKECSSCHGTSANTVIVTYSDVKKISEDILDSIQGSNKDMPQGSEMDSEDVKSFTAWLKGDMKESSEAEQDDKVNADDKATTSINSDSTDCSTKTDNPPEDDAVDTGIVTGNDDDEDDDDDWKASLNTEEFKKCKDEGKIFDRAKDECNKAAIATNFECTWEGVKVVFAKNDIENEIDAAKDAGYELDQCGEYKGEPIIYMLKKAKNDKNEDVLRRRKACFKGSKLVDLNVTNITTGNWQYC